MYIDPQTDYFLIRYRPCTVAEAKIRSDAILDLGGFFDFGSGRVRINFAKTDRYISIRTYESLLSQIGGTIALTYVRVGEKKELQV